MSIVEAAINKLHIARRRSNEDTRRDSSAAPAPADAAAAPAAERAPAHSIELNLEAIRAEGMLPSADRASQTADEFRRVKWPLLSDGAAGRKIPHGNLLLVSSALPAEGKSFISLNLALSIAQEHDKRVLLVDADIAKARISRLTRLQDRRGLTDLVEDPSLVPYDVIVGTNIPGLSLLPAGRYDAMSPELFASRRMEQLLLALAEGAADQVVVLDCAPLLATNEAQVLSRIAGQLIVVVRADSTPQGAVREALRLIDQNKPVHLLLNQVRQGWFSDRYANYYYAYHREQSR